MNVYINFVKKNMKQIIKTKALNPMEFELVNKLTGEIKEFDKDCKVFSTKLTGDVKYNSTDYSYLDNDKFIELFKKGIKYNELGVLILMSLQLLKRYNVCMYDSTTPFTTKSLSEILKITPQATRSIIRRLIDFNVVAQVSLDDRKDLGKVYIINPQFLRKGIQFSGKIGQYFREDKNW
jgi:hypothetical protein